MKAKKKDNKVKEKKSSKKKTNINKKENKKATNKVKNNKPVKKEIKKSVKQEQKKFKKEKSPSFTLVEVIIIMLVTIMVSSVGSGIFIYNNFEKISLKTSDNQNSKYILQFEKTFDTLTDNYINKINKQKLLDAAVSGMLEYLDDPYSSYLDESQTKNLINQLNTKYKGLGIEISSETGEIVIRNVYDGPAKNAGIKKGDIITKIDGKDYKNKTASDVSEYILNKKEDKISIEVLRNKKTIKFNVSKKKIDYPTVSSEKIDKIGYVSISSFSSKTSKQFNEVVTGLEKENINGLIIDLRQNSGGYLKSAYEIAEQFLPKGKNVYRLKTNLKTSVAKTKKSDHKTYKVVVLVDEGSASASEVLALALKEEYKAILVGERTYGKGTVQQTKTLSDGTIVKYTTSKWLSPSGKSIDKVGINPDYNVTYKLEKNNKYDTQLSKALDLLK